MSGRAPVLAARPINGNKFGDSGIKLCIPPILARCNCFFVEGLAQ